MKIYIVITLITLISLSGHLKSAAERIHFPAQAPSIDTISGSGRYLLRYRDTTLLTAPSRTNPHFLKAGPLAPISTDHQRGDEFLPDVSDAEMILVGHAYYNASDGCALHNEQACDEGTHLRFRDKENPIISVVNEDCILTLNGLIGKASTPGSWVYSLSGKIRIMPLQSAHTLHFIGIRLMQGQY